MFRNNPTTTFSLLIQSSVAITACVDLVCRLIADDGGLCWKRRSRWELPGDTGFMISAPVFAERLSLRGYIRCALFQLMISITFRSLVRVVPLCERFANLQIIRYYDADGLGVVDLLSRDNPTTTSEAFTFARSKWKQPWCVLSSARFALGVGNDVLDELYQTVPVLLC